MPVADGTVDEPGDDCGIQQGDQAGAGGDQAHEIGFRLCTYEFYGVDLWDESSAICIQRAPGMGVVCHHYPISLDIFRVDEVGRCEGMGTDE